VEAQSRWRCVGAPWRHHRLSSPERSELELWWAKIDAVFSYGAVVSWGACLVAFGKAAMTRGGRTSMKCFLQPSAAIGALLDGHLASGTAQTDAARCPCSRGVVDGVQHSTRRRGNRSSCC
jgi:hypothetical protein